MSGRRAVIKIKHLPLRSVDLHLVAGVAHQSIGRLAQLEQYHPQVADCARKVHDHDQQHGGDGVGRQSESRYHYSTFVYFWASINVQSIFQGRLSLCGTGVLEISPNPACCNRVCTTSAVI